MFSRMKNKLLSKSIEIKQKKRQSFSERINDELAEILLQYLSIEEKEKFESVCKLFQRNIYLKVFSLDLNDWIFWHNGYSCPECSQGWHFDLKKSETILKNCTNVESIEMRLFSGEIYSSFDGYNQMFGLIIKYCHNLRRIDCAFSFTIRRNSSKIY